MSNSVSETSLSGDIWRYARYQLRGRRGLIVAAIALGIPALWIGWPWLVVAGVAPLLIALAPCAIMCALGLCAMRAGANRAGADVASLDGDDADCCSTARPVERTAASMTASKLADERAEPMALALPLQTGASLDEVDNQARPEDTGQSEETTNQEKLQ
jgi:hypothetical protein